MRSTGWLNVVTGVVRGTPIKQAAATLIFAVLLSTVLVWTRGAIGCKPLVIASSQEKSEMLNDLADSYNKLGKRFGSGLNPLCVRVKVNTVFSGEAETALESNWIGEKSERPDVWAPGSSAWVELLMARGQAGLIPDDYVHKKLFSSPLVIAMPEPMAKALGYPDPRGWKDIFALATNPTGWGSKGHPEWGRFKLGKTNPHVSTSGLHALVGMYDAIQSGQNPEMVNTPAARAFAAAIEQSVIYYGRTARDFLRNLQDVDTHSASDPNHLAVLQYVSAVAIEEKELFDYNRGQYAAKKGTVPHITLRPVYPKKSPFADHPYVILNWPGAPASTSAAAIAFFNFLTDSTQQRTADENGFRQANGRPGPWLSQQLGVISSLPDPLPGRPGAVLAAEVKAWDQLRKPARVMILMNRSANGGGLHDAITQLQESLIGFQPQDRVMVAAYPSQPDSAEPFLVIQPMTPTDSAHLKRLRQAVDVSRLVVPPNAPSVLYPSLEGAEAWMSSSFVPTDINAILLIEMSPRPGNQPAETKLLDRLRNQSPSRFVYVFAVRPKLHEGEEDKVLTPITLAGEGALYQPDSAKRFLNDVISNF
jgi:Ca-activated chloride channel homolog